MTTDKTQQIHIRLPIKEWVWVKQRACDNGLYKLTDDSMSKIIVKGVELYIKKYAEFKDK